MKSILCFELKRCFGSKRLYLSLLTGIVISLLHIIFGVLPLTQWLSSWQGDFFLTPHSAYGHWIGMDSSTVWPTLLYMLLPFLCAFPFSDTVSWDFNTGYVMQIFVRRKKSTYLFAKALTIFIASAFLTATILFFDFAGTALYLPLVRPEALTNLYGISNRSLMAHLFYHNLYQQQAAAKEEVGKAFPYEEELRVKNARLVELDMELNMDSKGQSRPEAAIAKRERPSVLEGLKRPIPPRSMEKKPRQQEQEAR